MSQVIIHNQNEFTLPIAIQSNKYLESISNRLSKSTYKTYKQNLETFRDWFLSEPMTTSIEEHLQKYRNYLLTKYENTNSRNLALTTLRGLYKYLFEENIIEINPSLRIKNFRGNTDLKRSALTREQLSIIIHDLNSKKGRNSERNRVLFAFLVMNGLRVSELCDLKIEDFGIAGSRRVAYLLRKGHTSKDTFVILQDSTYQMIMDYIGDRTSGYVFLSERGGRITAGAVSHLIKKIYRDNGYDQAELTTHSTRHTYAQLSLEGGASLNALMKSMNHKNISTTTRYLESMSRFANSAEDCISVDFSA